MCVCAVFCGCSCACSSPSRRREPHRGQKHTPSVVPPSGCAAWSGAAPWLGGGGWDPYLLLSLIWGGVGRGRGWGEVWRMSLPGVQGAVGEVTTSPVGCSYTHSLRLVSLDKQQGM